MSPRRSNSARAGHLPVDVAVAAADLGASTGGSPTVTQRGATRGSPRGVTPAAESDSDPRVVTIERVNARADPSALPEEPRTSGSSPLSLLISLGTFCV